MVNDVTVAWATPVNAFALGAQIETHVESKASIHTFKLCVEYAQVSGESLGRLPPEMVEIVVAHIRQPFLDRFSAEWKKAERCCLAECKVSDHIDSEVLADMRAEYLSGYLSVDGCEDDSECEEAFEESVAESCVHDEEHRDHLQRFLSTIEVGTGKRYKRFAKCAKVFAQDFHLEVCFTVFRECQDQGVYHGCPRVTILAYLILPSVHSAMKTCPGPGTVSYLSSMIIDPSIFREPSAKEKKLFRETLRTLQLTPFVHEKQLTTSYPTSDRTSKATDEEASSAVPVDRALLSMKDKREQAAELASSDWPKLMVLASGEFEAHNDDYYDY